MRIAIDTNIYSALTRGEASVREILENAQIVCVPFVVIAELRAGFAVGTLGRANEKHLQRFLGREGIGPLYADDMTTRAYAALYRQLREQGTPMPTNDLWIAALVQQHGLTLFSRDSHFDRLPQLDRVAEG